MGQFEVRPVTPDMFPAWKELAREVEPLFEGAMADNPEFHEKMRRSVDEGRAFAAVDLNSRKVAGIIVVSGEKNRIAWLAVFEKYRGRGYGSSLLERAIAGLDTTSEIDVFTFREDNKEGLPARRLYEKYSFQDYDTNLIYNGQPRCLMRRPPQD